MLMMCVRGKLESLFLSLQLPALSISLQFCMGEAGRKSNDFLIRTIFLHSFWACDQSRGLQLRQSQTKGNGCPPEGAEERKVAPSSRARCPSGQTMRAAGREGPRSVGRAGSGKPEHRHLALAGRKTTPGPQSRLTRALEVPVEASHSRKALGDHGSAERRRLRARCPPVWG